MDKLAMKRKFLADGVPVPWFAPIDSAMELERVVLEEGFPLILKPVDSRGARGVLLLTPEVELQWAFELSLEHSPSGHLIVERYLEGPQLSTESLILDGAAHTIGVSDRNYGRMAEFAPFVVEDGGELPSRLPAQSLADAHGVVEAAARSLGVTNGVIKGDIVIHQDKAYVIEVAPRLSGGHFCTVEIPFSTGVDFVGNAIRIALGEKVTPEELVPRHHKHLCQRYLFPQPGRVSRISGADDVAARQELVHCEIRVAVGDTIGPIENHPGRAGVVMATGNSRDQAISHAQTAVRDIFIETEHE
jgi:biotin carboxylase